MDVPAGPTLHFVGQSKTVDGDQPVCARRDTEVTILKEPSWTVTHDIVLRNVAADNYLLRGPLVGWHTQFQMIDHLAKDTRSNEIEGLEVAAIVQLTRRIG